jgi:formylglycine-generating enzyme required for sulfatase activity
MAAAVAVADGQGALGGRVLQVAVAGHEGFAFVAGGSFLMGDQFGDGPWAMPESPPREVEVGDFLLAKHELTVGEFARFVEAANYTTVAEVDGPLIEKEILKRDPNYKDRGVYRNWRKHWFEQAPDHPVVMVAWEDAIVCCNWLSRQKGLPPAYDEKTGGLLDAEGRPTGDVRQVKGYRLPTEAEWEFAARERGRKVRFGNGQDIARSTEMNFDAAGTGQMIPSLRMPKDNMFPYNEKGIDRDTTTPVGSFRPNALGLYDMSGNAWEWCCDTSGPEYPTEKRGNPCAQDGDGHVIRGGMHDNDAKACRAAARIGWYRRALCPGSGFRLALTVDAPVAK